jgi:hypothetical protein
LTNYHALYFIKKIGISKTFFGIPRANYAENRRTVMKETSTKFQDNEEMIEIAEVRGNYGYTT